MYNENSDFSKDISDNTVIIVDDDIEVSHSLNNLLSSEGIKVKEFSTSQSFLAALMPERPACVILDMQMPDINGLEVATILNKNNITLPIIFLTGFGSIPLSVEVMKLGAHEFLTKPVLPDLLLSAVDKALKWDRNNINSRIELNELTIRYKSLTPREKNVLEFIIGGLMIKQIAFDLNVSEITIKVHKQKIMQKMKTKSLPELVRIAEKLNIKSAKIR
ncbi:response regulator [Pseudoalteromonas sp. B137]